MAFWLIKSEPDVFSIDDLAAKPGRRSGWDGVRNYQARNNLKAMQVGDLALFYHSNAAPSAVVGAARVTRTAFPDGPDPRWVQVEVEYAGRLARPVPLADAKAAPALKDMALVRYGRLSVQPVTAREWAAVLKMGGGLVLRPGHNHRFGGPGSGRMLGATSGAGWTPVTEEQRRRRPKMGPRSIGERKEFS